MAILCPYCGSGFNLKEIKPGRYKSKCSKCTRRFALIVSADPSEPPVTAPLPEEAGAAAPSPPPPTPAPAPPPAAPASPVATHGGNLDATLAAPQSAAYQLQDPDRTAPAGASERTALVGSEPTQPMAGISAAQGSMVMLRELNGYQIVKELGRGAMGAVYLARQISLDRDVALKVIQAQWASDPVFVARFTREAYAAAQLNHHNMVQIYDLGAAGNVPYFSMEFVRGQNLSDVIQAQGKLDPEVAIGYVLQAARGLEYAHNHGMVHRDIKPANLMVNENGIVKIADLGLVKTPQMAAEEESPQSSPEAAKATSAKKTLAASTADVTLANVAMGTPAYMAPEQAENAAGVDHRADIYSLGCTLYVLLTGRPPFEGTSALEVITKHRSEPVVRPDVLVKRIPKELADITLRMVAKRPEDRYPNLREVIHDLERYLGINSAGPFSPREEQVQLLEECAAAFTNRPLAKLRLPILAGFFGFCALIFLLATLILGWVWTAGGILGLATLTTLVYFVYSGWIERTYLFEKFRELVALARWSDWASWAAGGLVVLLLLFAFGLLWTWLSLAIIAAGCALAYYYLVDRRLAAERAEPLRKLRELLRSLRLKGADENALRQFVAKYSGEDWEELYESLFGYEAKLEARTLFGRGEQGRNRNRFRPWREPIVRWVNDRIRQAKEANSRKFLQEVEEKNLTAQGLQPMQARRQAQRMADAMVAGAAPPPPVQVPAQKPVEAAPPDPGEAVRHKREWVKQMLADARAGADARKKEKQRSRMLAPLFFVLGPQVRFLLGCLLLAGFALWARQNNAVNVDTQVLSNLPNAQDLGDVKNAVKFDATKTGTKPLGIPVVGQFFDSFNPGIAGAMLLFLGLFRGWKMSLYALPAAAIIVLGPSLGMPGIPMLGGGYATSAAIGLTIGALGFLYGQTFDDDSWRVE